MAPASRTQLSVAISDSQGAQQQTYLPLVLLSIDRIDRQTNGRTPDRYIDHAPRVSRAASITVTA